MKFNYSKDDIWSLIPLKKERSFIHFSKPSKVFVYTKKVKRNLLSGFEECVSLSEIRDTFRKLSLKDSCEKPVLFHLFYEAHCIFDENLDHISENDILLIELHFEKAISIKLSQEDSFKKKINLKRVKSDLTFKNYDKSFNKVYEHLLRGDCYQINLTFPSLFSFNKEVEPHNFVKNLWKNSEAIGDYGHCTWLGPLNRLLLSNTPECLFHLKKKGDDLNIYSMPIKGSLKISKEKDKKKDWEKLQCSKKDQGELFMISDMLRNDLSKINNPYSRVIKKKIPLWVPGILHQYSLIEVSLEKSTSLFDVLNAVFPGGSITGAPKKKVIGLLKKLESPNPRGFYCGSTILLHKSMIAASINIRSSDICFEKKSLKYSTGSGITLLSNSKEEFKELELKESSVLGLF